MQGTKSQVRNERQGTQGCFSSSFVSLVSFPCIFDFGLHLLLALLRCCYTPFPSLQCLPSRSFCSFRLCFFFVPTRFDSLPATQISLCTTLILCLAFLFSLPASVLILNSACLLVCLFIFSLLPATFALLPLLCTLAFPLSRYCQPFCSVLSVSTVFLFVICSS